MNNNQKTLENCSTKCNDLVPQRIDLPKNIEARKNEIRKLVPRLAQAEAKLDMYAAQVLAEVVAGKYYKDWGYDSFDAYLEAETVFQRRKAYYLIQIHTKFVQECGVKTEQLEKFGWVKAKELAPIITPKNCQRLLDQTKDMTFDKIEQMVKAKRPKIIHQGAMPPATTTDDEVYEETFYFVKEQYDNIKKALEVAGEESGSTRKGHLLDLICTDFLASKAEATGIEAAAERLGRILKNLERVYDISLKVEG